MGERLRQHIGEVYDGGAWEAVTGKLFEYGTPWSVQKFERDVEFDGSVWRCVILEKVVYDPDDAEAVDYTVPLLEEAWEL